MTRPRCYSDEAVARFWAKVDKSGDCWLWTGHRRSKGYGVFYYRGRSLHAHRVGWEIEHDQPFPPGLLGCHHCDNPPCVRPSHIFPGTKSDNAKDAIAKGRPWAKGKKSTCHKGHEFTEENTYRRSDGKRACRTCHRAYEKGRKRPPRGHWYPPGHPKRREKVA